jgi:hypothetical protein
LLLVGQTSGSDELEAIVMIDGQGKSGLPASIWYLIVFSVKPHNPESMRICTHSNMHSTGFCLSQTHLFSLASQRQDRLTCSALYPGQHLSSKDSVGDLLSLLEYVCVEASKVIKESCHKPFESTVSLLVYRCQSVHYLHRR